MTAADFGTRLAQARTQRALSIRSLAVLAGLNPQSIQNLQNNRHSPTIATVEALASALQVDPRWLAFGPKVQGEDSD